MPARRFIHTLRDGKSRRLSRREIVQVDVFVAVNIGAEQDVLAVGREVASANFPLVLGEPLDLLWNEGSCLFTFRPDVKQPDVVISVGRIRRDQYGLDIFQADPCEIVRIVALLALVRREQSALSRSYVGDK